MEADKTYWGGLEQPEKHLAAIGARLIDSRSRGLQVLWDRASQTGDEKVCERLWKWWFAKGAKIIRKNTRFCYGLEGANTYETDIQLGKTITIHLKARCAGEYCYLAAYADKAA